jgi:hypothetical protein
VVWITLVPSSPLDFVFAYFVDNSNALHHVGDVVNAALLHAKLPGSLLQIDLVVWVSLENPNKLFGQLL